MVIRLMKWAIGGGVVAIFTAGALWASAKDTLRLVPPLVDSMAALQRERDEDRQVLWDFMLLSCAKDTLNSMERRICARYEPRMPR